MVVPSDAACAHHAAAGHAVGGAIAHCRNKAFHQARQAVDVDELFQNAAFTAAEHFGRATRLHAAGIAARSDATHHVRERMGTRILDMRASDSTREAARVALGAVGRGGTHRIAARHAVDIGMLDRGNHHIERGEHVGQIDGRTQNA